MTRSELMGFQTCSECRSLANVRLHTEKDVHGCVVREAESVDCPTCGVTRMQPWISQDCVSSRSER
jgi:hypothetical protein